MEDDLISKKELLTLTGISYGQLYRWKRKGLIPEDWFIRRSTYTGQETFFPRGRMLERIGRITSMKTDVSLDELAGVFSPKVGSVSLTAGQAAQRGVADEGAAAVFASAYGEGPCGFDDLVLMAVLDRLFKTGGVSRDEALSVLSTLKGALGEFADGFCEVIAVRKLGVLVCFVAASPCKVRFEEGVTPTARISVPEVKEELKLKLL
jgi:hypothetical protein